MPTKQIALRLDEELLRYLEDRANREHRTLSNMIISILLDAQENDLCRKFYSSDVLPTKGVPHGYAIRMEDTKDIFIFDAETQTWIQHMPLE